MTGMDLVDFLKARLDEAEQLALAAEVDFDMTRVLADIESKRRIIELHTGDHECSTYDHNGEIDNCTWVIGDCSTLQLLALPDADHPDYRPEWRTA